SMTETASFILKTTKSEQSSDSPVTGESLLCVFGHGWLALADYGQAKAIRPKATLFPCHIAKIAGSPGCSSDGQTHFPVPSSRSSGKKSWSMVY
ncbi:hypothetical protein J7E73_30640, partial [Paenibacillus albidus]|uniref:hypothetical protein n=1 Tax=Paenibacillus albidus TaxID=2041023 RepID=UPI001BEC743E